MNKYTAELLEKHFDTAFAASDGIKKLRELILTLAMQGRLVPQAPNDPPASELLKDIEAERQRLVKEGKIKKPKLLPPVTEDEKPYTLPKGWEWVRLGNIGLINPRNNVDDDISAGFVPMPLIQGGYSEFHSFVECPWKEIKKGYTHFADGDIGMAKITPCFENAKSCVFSELPNRIGAGTTELHIFRNVFHVVEPRYLLFFIKNPKFISEMAAKMTGSAGQKRVPTPLFMELKLPLPPLSEQHRIVAKIDELMARCDKLEKLHAAMREKRLTVHTAAIKQLLTIANPEQHQYALGFLSEHFGELYSVKENVAELRKAILQLAVMGKLVAQDPNDPPASELLKAIETEKQRLVNEGKIKKAKPLPPISEKEKPYTLPQGWEWVRLGELAEFINGDRGKNYPNREEYVSEGIPWINTGHIESCGSLTCCGMNFITREKFETLNSGKIKPGDLVYCLRGATFGKTAIVDPYTEGAIASSLMIIRPYSSVFNRYMYQYLISPVGRSQIFRFDNGSAQPNLSANNVRLYIYPLPSLAEQHRIVTKINQLMALCDSLDQQIDATTNKQSELLNALLHTLSQSNTETENQSVSLVKAQVIDLASYRTCMGGYALNKLANAQYFGRTAAAKVMYLAQAHVGLDLDLTPERQAAGPLDTWIYEFERQGRDKHWFDVNEKSLARGKKKTEYRCLPALSELVTKAERLMSTNQQTEFDRLIYALADKTTEEVEVIATLFAVWNDFLIDGIQPSDQQIIADFRENWHQRKARFTPDELGRWLDWLRREHIIPQGRPPRTVPQVSLLEQ